MLLYFYAKYQKNSECQFFIKKTCPSWPKILKTSKITKKKKKKKKRLHPLSFHKTCKTLCLAHFGTFRPKNTRTRFFLKNWAPSLSKIDEILTWYKKLKTFYEWFWRKTPNKKTNGHTKHIYWRYFKGPALCGFKNISFHRFGLKQSEVSDTAVTSLLAVLNMPKRNKIYQ